MSGAVGLALALAPSPVGERRTGELAAGESERARAVEGLRLRGAPAPDRASAAGQTTAGRRRR